MVELVDLLGAAAEGRALPTGGELTVLAPPDDRSVGVFAFAGANVVSADVSEEWVRNRLPPDDLSAPLNPPFLTQLSVATGRSLENLDLVLAARATGRRGLTLTELSAAADHPRVARARDHRAAVTAWSTSGGLVLLGRGVGGRWEVAVEVDPELRGFGLGRGLFAAALGLLPPTETVWAQIAPGNAPSVRAAIAAGYRPVGAEMLLVHASVGGENGGLADSFGWFTTDKGDGRLGGPSANGHHLAESKPDDQDELPESG